MRFTHLLLASISVLDHHKCDPTTELFRIKSAIPEGLNNVGTRGLVNLGSTCYFNAVLEVMLHAKPIVEYFITNDFDWSMDISNNPQAKAVESFRGLLKNEWVDNGAGSTAAIRPLEFFKSLAVFNDYLFVAGQQQDAYEAFVSITDILRESMNLLMDTGFLGIAGNNSTLSIQKSFDVFRIGLSARKFCYPEDLSIYEERPEIEFSLRFDVPVSKSAVDLNIAASFEAETLEDVDCPDGKHNVTRKRVLSSLPKILTVLAQRTAKNGVKVMTPVKAPLEIDVSSFLDTTTEVIGSPHYRLVGVVYHLGASQQGGHYNAHFLHPYNGNWYMGDDASVRQVKSSDLNQPSGNGLIYMYEQVE